MTIGRFLKTEEAAGHMGERTMRNVLSAVALLDVSGPGRHGPSRPPQPGKPDRVPPPFRQSRAVCKILRQSGAGQLADAGPCDRACSSLRLSRRSQTSVPALDTSACGWQRRFLEGSFTPSIWSPVDARAHSQTGGRRRAGTNLTTVQAGGASPNLPKPVDIAIVINTYHHLPSRPT